MQNDVEAALVSEDIHKAQEETRDALSQAWHRVDSGLTLLGVNQAVEVIVEVLVVPELHQGFRKIRLYPWRINTEPFIEAVAPTFELTLFINFRTILLVDPVGNITKLDNAAWCDLLLLQIHNVSLVP